MLEFGASVESTDINRVLRLPGFANTNYPERPYVKNLELNAAVHKRAAFKVHLPKVEKKTYTGPVDSGYKRLFSELGWEPFVKRVGNLSDAKLRMTDEPGATFPCPFHEHGDYSNCFGVQASNPALVHCFSKCNATGKSTWDLVAAIQKIENLENAGGSLA